MHLKLPEWAFELFQPKRYKIFYGGRGGAKSWAFAIALLTIGMERSIRVLCARELQVSIADSVHKLLSDIIMANEGMMAFYSITQTSITGVNGTEFAFRGLKHNVNGIRSFEGVDYCWVEEAQAVSDRSWESLIPTIRKDNSEIWVCFNPKNPTDPTWQRFVARQRENAIVRHVGWQDNPFFPSVLNDERLDLLEHDKEAYDHVWDGSFDTRYSGAVYAPYVKQDQISDKVTHDPAYPVYTAWDLGWGDATSIIFYQVGIGEIFIIDYYEGNQKDTKHYCEVLAGREIIVDERNLQTGEITQWRYGEDLEQHSHRKEYNYHPDHAHYVPHDGANKVQAAGGKSIIEQAARYGVRMFKLLAGSHTDDHDALRSVLHRCWINAERCGDLVQALMHYHFEYDEDKKNWSKVAVHDWSSHACDAAEIMAKVYVDRAVTTKQLADKATDNKFHRLRRENKLNKTDPYRIKPLRKK